MTTEKTEKPKLSEVIARNARLVVDLKTLTDKQASLVAENKALVASLDALSARNAAQAATIADFQNVASAAPGANSDFEQAQSDDISVIDELRTDRENLTARLARCNAAYSELLKTSKANSQKIALVRSILDNKVKDITLEG